MNQPLTLLQRNCLDETGQPDTASGPADPVGEIASVLTDAEPASELSGGQFIMLADTARPGATISEQSMQFMGMAGYEDEEAEAMLDDNFYGHCLYLMPLAKTEASKLADVQVFPFRNVEPPKGVAGVIELPVSDSAAYAKDKAAIKHASKLAAQMGRAVAVYRIACTAGSVELVAGSPVAPPGMTAGKPDLLELEVADGKVKAKNNKKPKTEQQTQIAEISEYVAGTFDYVWQQMKNSDLTNQQKGEHFERLILHYLKAHPSWNELFSDVKMWVDRQQLDGWDDEITGTLGHGDIGVDLIAKFADSEEGESDWMAIQCKYSGDGDGTLPKKQVDSFLNASRFARQRILATIKSPSSNVMKQLMSDDKPVTVLDLDKLRQAKFHWATMQEKAEATRYIGETYDVREHQEAAINNVRNHFYKDRKKRAQVILPCGSGKTFTALKLAEEVGGIRSRKDEPVRVLYLLPSISLLAQTMREWSEQRDGGMRHKYVGVCSDKTAGKAAVDEFGTLSELEGEVTTNPEKIAARLTRKYKNVHLLVVFSTYQSSHLIKKAQKEQNAPDFDLIICDEAHRTSGVDLPGEDTSNFLLAHDNEHIASEKRLYMTATPKVYLDAAKGKAKDNHAMLYSMDDTDKFGEVVYKMDFAEAIENELLTQYEILAIAIDPGFQKILRESGQLPDDPALEDFAIKAIGTAKALAGDSSDGEKWDVLRKSIAFTNRVKDSRAYSEYLPTTAAIVSSLSGGGERFGVDARHIDGTSPSSQRRADLDWLAKPGGGEIKVLCNAKCLGEGVDVPALDSVVFLSPKEATIDIIQQVGRVMRRAEGKERGYVVVPLLLDNTLFHEEGITKSGDYRTLIKVAKALKSHDGRMADMLNFKDLSNVQVRHVKPSKKDIDNSNLTAEEKDQLRQTLGNITGDLVEAVKVSLYQGAADKEYWKKWATDIGLETIDLQEEILEYLEQTDNRKVYDRFLKGARKTMSANMTDKEAVSFLAQFIVTRPVFEALYANYGFADNNSVSKILNQVCKELEKGGVGVDITQRHNDFYESVRKHVDGTKGTEARHELIKELYETFLRTAFPEETEKQGVVYTPIEIVDWLIRSTDEVLRQEFGMKLEDPNVEILDPFSGAGTFTVRSVQMEHTRPDEPDRTHMISLDKLPHKFHKEIKAIEKMPTAYFISDVNMEEAYHGRMLQADPNHQYENYDGIALSDTFMISPVPGKNGQHQDGLFGNIQETNTAQINEIAQGPVKVIMTNPPWRAGQDDATDNNQNEAYPELDLLIDQTYAKKSTSTLKRHLYDLYLKAIRWASTRIGDEGVISMVTNGSWLDGAAANGVRASLSEEFDRVYVYDLRGRLGAEGDGGNVFNVKVPVTMLVLVKNPKSPSNKGIFYAESPENSTREDKLKQLSAEGSLAATKWQRVQPDKHQDWINQRDENYQNYLAIGSKGTKSGDDDSSAFRLYSLGIATNRDLWAYDSNKDELADRSARAIDFYNQQLDSGDTENFTSDPEIFKWYGDLKSSIQSGVRLNNDVNIRKASFRPFYPQYLHYDSGLNARHGKMDDLYPIDIATPNISINTPSKSSGDFSTIMTIPPPDLHLMEAGGQAFCQYRYNKLSVLRAEQRQRIALNIDVRDVAGSGVGASQSDVRDVPVRETGIGESEARGYL